MGTPGDQQHCDQIVGTTSAASTATAAEEEPAGGDGGGQVVGDVDSGGCPLLPHQQENTLEPPPQPPPQLSLLQTPPSTSSVLVIHSGNDSSGVIAPALQDDSSKSLLGAAAFPDMTVLSRIIPFAAGVGSDITRSLGISSEGTLVLLNYAPTDISLVVDTSPQSQPQPKPGPSGIKSSKTKPPPQLQPPPKPLPTSPSPVATSDDARPGPSGIQSASAKKTSGKSKKLPVCTVCQKAFGSPSRLLKHEQQHHAHATFKCEHCKKAFTSKFKLVRHALIHSDRKPFCCSVCTRTFHRKDHLKNHFKVHSQSKELFVCTRAHCKKEYTSHLSYKKHQALHAAEDGVLDCQICHATFRTRDDVLGHLKVHQGTKPVKNPDEKKFTCEQCDRRFFTRKDVRRHLVVHTGRRDFLCQYCPQCFGRKDHLIRHIKKSHTTTKPTAAVADASNIAASRLIKAEPQELPSQPSQLPPEPPITVPPQPPDTITTIKLEVEESSSLSNSEYLPSIECFLPSASMSSPHDLDDFIQSLDATFSEDDDVDDVDGKSAVVRSVVIDGVSELKDLGGDILSDIDAGGSSEATTTTTTTSSDPLLGAPSTSSAVLTGSSNTGDIVDDATAAAFVGGKLPAFNQIFQLHNTQP